MISDHTSHTRLASTRIENVYGSARRLQWIGSRLSEGDRVLEFGCGTGCMISLPLAIQGVDIVGVDLDERSIEFGRDIFARQGVDAQRLSASPLAETGPQFDVIIASEVLEHIETRDLAPVMSTLRRRLKPEGLLLVTVPNGYGLFEIESFFWNRLGFGKLVATMRIDRGISLLRRMAIGHSAREPFPSTLADDVSPHVQRFTMRSIQCLLANNGFAVEDVEGSVFWAGPFADMVFRGAGPILRLNGKIGRAVPGFASGYFITARRPRDISTR